MQAGTFKGATPLYSAVYAEKFDTCKFLIKYGADVNIQTDAGWSPLHVAVDKGLFDYVKLLVNNGAVFANTSTSMKTNEGKSVYMIAQEKGYSNILNFLPKLVAILVNQPKRYFKVLHV